MTEYSVEVSQLRQWIVRTLDGVFYIDAWSIQVDRGVLLFIGEGNQLIRAMAKGVWSEVAAGDIIES